jgi:voltage-gated potassium channel
LLLVVELVWGLTQALWITGQVIWVIFIAEFALSLALAPRKLRYVRDNWLKALSLLAPALRVLRIARLARLARAGAASKGLRLLRVVGSMNRGMKALGAAMGRRGFGYVLTLTVLVAFVGAAGMYALERDAPGGGFDSYASALWWTAMVLATMGSEYWPKTPDGRLLCLFLAVYAFTVFGYVTATLATFFIGSDARDENAGLRSELALLREELRAAREK